MSCVIYKNLLIVDRGSPYISYIESLNISFENDYSPFRYKSNDDKIILFYETSLTFNDSIKHVTTSFELNMLKYKNCIGIIKLYCDKTHLKVYYCDFKNLSYLKQYFILLKEFIIKCISLQIKNENDVDNANYYIHWDNNIVNQSNVVILKELDMIGEGQYYSYKFTTENIKRFINWLNLNIYNKMPNNTMEMG